MKKPAALTSVVWVLALATVALDQLTKQWALTSLTPNQRIPILGNALGFELIFNPGAAFSFGEGATVVFTVVAGAVVLGIPFVARKVASRAWAVWLGIVWGGAAGNLADRIFRSPGAGRGHVVDFIAYFDWFIGNVADIALVVGIAAVGILVFRGVEFGPAAGDGGAPKEDNNG